MIKVKKIFEDLLHNLKRLIAINNLLIWYSPRNSIYYIIRLTCCIYSVII